MTCRHSRTLLEEYVDSEVDLATAEALKAHLLECAECRDEVESSAILKSMIKGLSRPDPGEEYWNEVSALVLARTVEVDVEPEPQYTRVIPVMTADDRSTLLRSVASVAFSLVVLFGAIWLGSQRHGSFIVQTPSQEFLVAASLNSSTNHTDQIYTRQDQLRLSRGLALIGPPVHGRIAQIASLLLVE